MTRTAPIRRPGRCHRVRSGRRTRGSYLQPRRVSTESDTERWSPRWSPGSWVRVALSLRDEFRDRLALARRGAASARCRSSSSWAIRSSFMPPKSRLCRDILTTILEIRPLGESENTGFVGAGARIRTADLLITNQLLFRLSYTGFRRHYTEGGRVLPAGAASGGPGAGGARGRWRAAPPRPDDGAHFARSVVSPVAPARNDARTRSAAPTVIAASATLKAGQWYDP